MEKPLKSIGIVIAIEKQDDIFEYSVYISTQKITLAYLPWSKDWEIICFALYAAYQKGLDSK